MKEIFVVEHMLAPGVWELVNSLFYWTEKEAVKIWAELDSYSTKHKLNNIYRVTKLTDEMPPERLNPKL